MEESATHLTTLDLINELSNERQQLWREAAHQRFSAERTERIQIITRRLDTLWGLHRLEQAGRAVSARNVDLLSDLFDDFRARAGQSSAVSIWRIEDETADGRRYMSIEAGFRDNQYAHYLKKPTKRQAKKHRRARQKQQPA